MLPHIVGGGGSFTCTEYGQKETLADSYVPDIAVPLTPFDNALPYWDPKQLRSSCVGIEMNRTVGERLNRRDASTKNLS